MTLMFGELDRDEAGVGDAPLGLELVEEADSSWPCPSSVLQKNREIGIAWLTRRRTYK